MLVRRFEPTTLEASLIVVAKLNRGGDGVEPARKQFGVWKILESNPVIESAQDDFMFPLTRKSHCSRPPTLFLSKKIQDGALIFCGERERERWHLPTGKKFMHHSPRIIYNGLCTIKLQNHTNNITWWFHFLI